MCCVNPAVIYSVIINSLTNYALVQYVNQVIRVRIYR